MKKFLSFALALAMTASLVPATAFAATDARVNKVITAEADDDFYTGTGDTKEANYLILKADGVFKEATQEFEVKLENAEWYENASGKTMIDGLSGKFKDTIGASDELDGQIATAQADLDVKQAKVDILATSADLIAYEAQAGKVTTAEGTVATEKTDLANAEKAVLDQEKEIAKANLAVTTKDSLYAAALEEKAAAKYVTAKADGSTPAKNIQKVAMTVAPTMDDLYDTNKFVYYVASVGGSAVTDKTGATALADEFTTDTAKFNIYNDAKTYFEGVDKKVVDTKKEADDAKVAARVATDALVALKTAVDTAKTDLAKAEADLATEKAKLATMSTPQDYKDAVAARDAAQKELARLNAMATGTAGGTGDATFEVTKKSASTIIVRTTGTIKKDDELQIPLWVNLTGGNATVSVDAKNSEFTSETKTFAKTVDGATVFTTEGVKNFYDGEALKDFFLEEVTPGTFEAGKKATVRVSGGFEFEKNKGEITVIAGDLAAKNTKIPYTCDGDEIFFTMPSKSTTISQIRFSGFELDEDGADYGDDAELTISGAGIDRTTIKVGTYADFGITMEAEDKELPVIYAGTKADSDNDNTTLKVVIEETVAGSFIANRKVELKLPEGVEFSNVNEGIDDSGSSFKVSNFKDNKGTVQAKFDCNSDGDKITINGMPAASGDSKKRKVEVVFDISAAADFTGDVDLTLTGPGVANEELTTTIATVKAPIEVKADVNELKLDYRNTEASDITLVEPAAGVWDKNDKIILEVEEMQFESGIKAEVVSGDIKLKKLDGDYVDVNKKNGTITIEVDSKSGKTPAEIKISGVKLYMDRNLPAGDYKLNVYGDKNNETFINNYDAKGDDDMPNFFDTDSITAMNDYIKVVTAGRDQDDATFTTKITVPVGADKIMAGTKEIALDAPAYINKDGYTMLPVRAVTEALNGVAAIKWDNDTKTATINFGQRVFSMTVNSKVMNINGVQTNVLAAPEIKNDRIFLPLRDLGYALGLTDSKIAWDSATSTATLN